MRNRDRRRAFDSCAELRSTAPEGDRDGLLDRLADCDGIGIGQRQGPAIGLVRGVRPVALVLHLEDVADHADVDGAVAHSVAQTGNVARGLAGPDGAGETCRLEGAVGVDHLERFTRESDNRVQQGEACATDRHLPFHVEDQSDLDRSVAGRIHLEAALQSVVPDRELPPDGKAFVGLFDSLGIDMGRRRAPVGVAYRIGRSAQQLDAAPDERAQPCLGQGYREVADRQPRRQGRHPPRLIGTDFWFHDDLRYTDYTSWWRGTSA